MNWNWIICGFGLFSNHDICIPQKSSELNISSFRPMKFGDFFSESLHDYILNIPTLHSGISEYSSASLSNSFDNTSEQSMHWMFFTIE